MELNNERVPSAKEQDFSFFNYLCKGPLSFDLRFAAGTAVFVFTLSGAITLLSNTIHGYAESYLPTAYASLAMLIIISTYNLLKRHLDWRSNFPLNSDAIFIASRKRWISSNDIRDLEAQGEIINIYLKAETSYFSISTPITLVCTDAKVREIIFRRIEPNPKTR